MRRCVLWLGTALVGAGLGAATVAGAGLAGAQPDSATGVTTAAESGPESGDRGAGDGRRPVDRAGLRTVVGEGQPTGTPRVRAAGDGVADAAAFDEAADAASNPVRRPRNRSAARTADDVDTGAAEADVREAQADLTDATLGAGSSDVPAGSADTTVPGAADTIPTEAAGTVAEQPADAAADRAADAADVATAGTGTAVSRRAEAGGEPIAGLPKRARARLDIGDIEQRAVVLAPPGPPTGADVAGASVDVATAEPRDEVPAVRQPDPGLAVAPERDPPTGTVAASVATAVAPSASITDMVSALQLPPLLNLIGSAVFTAFGALTRIVGGSPILPPASTATVGTSTLEIAEGQTVDANWYFPEGDEAPERMIYLQHGFLAAGPWYSFTAAYLAETTHSVVVTPTITSNVFAADGFWLGSDSAHQAVGELFVGDRQALNDSALAAGYADEYGDATALPDSFVVSGHSLGGGLAAGAAGYYAEATIAAGADNDLAGVVLFDAVPPGSTLPDALTKLDGLQDYVPVLEIGAPANLLNSTSTVNQDLIEARPGMFNGVVLAGGSHMDSMLGGNPLIQIAGYVVGGFPRPQNPLALQILAAGWMIDMFEGNVDESTGACQGHECRGSYAAPGDTLRIDTAKGAAAADVIGEPIIVAVGQVGTDPTNLAV